MSNLATLKNSAVCLGCCESTKDNPANSNDEAIAFICDHIGAVATSGVTDITLKIAPNGKVERGEWTDTAGEKHSITISK